MAIDYMRQDRENRIKDIKKESEYVFYGHSYEKEIRELENTKKRLTDTPNCR